MTDKDNRMNNLWVGMSDRVFNYYVEKERLPFMWVDTENLGQIDNGEILFHDPSFASKFQLDDGSLNDAFFALAADIAAKQIPSSSLQVLLDRWRDGNQVNNIPTYSCVEDTKVREDMCKAAMVNVYDPTKQNPGKYFGGDVEGFVETLPYIQDLGFQSAWISPLWSNARGMAQGSGKYAEENTISGYHGYWGRDFCDLDPHLGSNRVEDQTLLSAMHLLAEQKGISLQVDLIMNHSGPRVGTMDAGIITCNNRLKADYWKEHLEMGLRRDEFDQNPLGPHTFTPFFHHTPNIGWWQFRPTSDSTYFTERQVGTLADLTDLNVENNEEARGLITESTKIWTGVSGGGARIDTLFYVPTWFPLQQVEMIRKASNEHKLIVGEWFDALHPEDLYDAGIAFYLLAPKDPDQFIDIFDFGFHYATHKSFAFEHASLDPLVKHLDKLDKYGIPVLRRLSPFVDNHDLPVLLNDMQWPQFDQLHQALAVSYMLPGTPYVYGQNLEYVYDHTWKRGLFGIGGDPMNRGMVDPPIDPKHFEEKPVARLVKAFNEFRKENGAVLDFGEMSGGVVRNWFESLIGKSTFGDDDVVAIKRTFQNREVLFLHVREDGSKSADDVLKTVEIDWPDGWYDDPISGIRYLVSNNTLQPVSGTYHDKVWNRDVVVDDQHNIHLADGKWTNSATGNVFDIKLDGAVPPNGTYLPHKPLENELCDPEASWSNMYKEEPWKNCSTYSVNNGMVYFETADPINASGLEDGRTYEIPDDTGRRFRWQNGQPVLADGRYRLTSENGKDEVVEIKNGRVEMLPPYRTVILVKR